MDIFLVVIGVVILACLAARALIVNGGPEPLGKCNECETPAEHLWFDDAQLCDKCDEKGWGDNEAIQ